MDVKGARVGLLLTTMEGCDPKGPLPGMHEEARAYFAFSERIVSLVVKRGIWLCRALGARLHAEISTADFRSVIMFCVHRWAHAETRSTFYWGPHSRHELPPVEGSCAVVGSGGVRAAKCIDVYVTIDRVGEGERPHMYRLVGYREDGSHH